MSDSCLDHWIEELLFGSTTSFLPLPPPSPIRNLILRLEAENIPWAHIMARGGFTHFPYQVHGDLNSLIDYLEEHWLEGMPEVRPPCKTKAVAKFWNQLQMLLARREEARRPALPMPSREDDAILKELLEPTQPYESYAYQSAAFWGEVARRFINLRRPEPPSTLPPPSLPSEHHQRALQLYDMTCFARGHFFDPLSARLVHHAEYVNAAHWQTPRNLEAFMHDRPSHPLTLSVQSLLKRTVDQLLEGERPSAFLARCPRLDALLHNVRVIHESVQQVPHEAETPPKLIDIFQRLLALSYQDRLWEKVIPAHEPPADAVGTSLLYLTEQLRIAEREKRVLWRQVTERGEEFAPKPSPRICSGSWHASDRRPRSPEGRERQTFRR